MEAIKKESMVKDFYDRHKEEPKHIHQMEFKVDKETGDEYGQCKCGAVETVW